MLTRRQVAPAPLASHPTRREALRNTAAGAGAAWLAASAVGQPSADPGAGAAQSCIILFLVGGPSQLDTWDLKPLAPAAVRGPFRPIASTVPGIQVSELFPRTAAQAEHFALIRSVHHHESPVHETGHQLMQTGQLVQRGLEYPHFGAAFSCLRGQKSPGVPPFVILPKPIGNTGISISHGQGAGFLGAQHEPVVVRPGQDLSGQDISGRDLAVGFQSALRVSTEPSHHHDLYGASDFGQSCLTARRLVEAGVRVVTVNMFDSLFNQLTWDCHADGGALRTTLQDYRNTVCPIFDRAYAGLLEDLRQRGLLASTLVVAMGEFGRTPYLNARGGRDHWPGVWSILLAGGPVRGGQVIGASDALGARPRDRPVTPAEVAASIYTALGIPRSTCLTARDGRLLALNSADPIGELF